MKYPLLGVGLYLLLGFLVIAQLWTLSKHLSCLKCIFMFNNSNSNLAKKLHEQKNKMINDLYIEQNRNNGLLKELANSGQKIKKLHWTLSTHNSSFSSNEMFDRIDRYRSEMLVKFNIQKKLSDFCAKYDLLSLADDFFIKINKELNREIQLFSSQLSQFYIDFIVESIVSKIKTSIWNILKFDVNFDSNILKSSIDILVESIKRLLNYNGAKKPYLLKDPSMFCDMIKESNKEKDKNMLKIVNLMIELEKLNELQAIFNNAFSTINEEIFYKDKYGPEFNELNRLSKLYRAFLSEEYDRDNPKFVKEAIFNIKSNPNHSVEWSCSLFKIYVQDIILKVEEFILKKKAGNCENAIIRVR